VLSKIGYKLLNITLQHTLLSYTTKFSLYNHPNYHSLTKFQKYLISDVSFQVINSTQLATMGCGSACTRGYTRPEPTSTRGLGSGWVDYHYLVWCGTTSAGTGIPGFTRNEHDFGARTFFYLCMFSKLLMMKQLQYGT